MFVKIERFHRKDAELPYIDTGGNGPLLHLSHANGLPAFAYEPLIEDLARDFRVVALGHRGQLGGASEIKDWHQLARDIIAFLEWLDAGKAYHIGHSIGAVTGMFAAARRPDLFSRLLMIDPVLLSSKICAQIRVARLLGLKGYHPLAKRARNRRNAWADKQEAFEFFKTRSLFKTWREDFLRSYVEHCLVPAPHGGGVVLLCPPEAEARGFENYSPDVWAWPARVTSFTMILRGEHSDTLTPDCFDRFRRLCRGCASLEVKGAGHLIPMEKPDKTLGIIRKFF
jgi:pimeloyl-ACP methyl ester carboxylesterase